MTAEQTFVIVGAALGGAKAAEALRTEGFGGRVILMGEETERPYERPPLSKDYLQGKSEKEKIYVHPEGWYAEHDVDLRLGTRVTAIDRTAREVSVEGGERVRYDKLLLATGSSPRRLTAPGSDLDGVLYLRRIEDCEAIKAAFGTAKRVAIIGAGWIGLETAAAARAAGCEVTVIEMAELPLLAALGREVAEIYATVHREHGVQLRLGTMLAEITGQDNRATGVRLADGDAVEADAVVVGVGIIPNTELAEASGLNVDNGIVVDEHLATTDPDVFAVGDVANAYYPHLGTHLRLEHWAAALNQGPVAAANMVGRAASYDDVPYFFSDQYDMGMEYSGYVQAGRYDEVVFRGDVAKGEFIAFWMNDRRVLAGMNVNVWDCTDAIQALVRSGVQVDPVKLTDPEVPLADLQGDVGVDPLRWTP
ncbi:MAG: NAD(P)/FAD-dependent oxidoreductase [Geodermatophilaceae bacterium]